jgi:hypothetical protein
MPRTLTAALAVLLLAAALQNAAPQLDPSGKADSSEALQALLDAGPRTIQLEEGTYRCDATLEVRRTVRLVGRSGPYPTGKTAATVLLFPADTVGLEVTRTPATTEGDRCHFVGLCVRGGRGTDRTAHGWKVHASRCRWERCTAELFAGDGYHFEANTADVPVPANVNLWHLDGCAAYRNGGAGLLVRGADANAGRAIGLDSAGNAGRGVDDSDNFGNGYFACHVGANAGGAYKIAGGSNCGVLLGCYSEASSPTALQPPSWIEQRAIVVGGPHGSSHDPAVTWPGLWLDSSWLGGSIGPQRSWAIRQGSATKRTYCQTAPPAGEFYPDGVRVSVGDHVRSPSPRSGQPIGWACTKATPGQAPAWRAFGRLE